jgi:hypothetical protein
VDIAGEASKIGQQEGDQYRGEVAHNLLPSSSVISKGKVNPLKKVWEKLNNLTQFFYRYENRSATWARWTSVLRRKNDMKVYKGREIETEQLNDGKWIVCAQDNNGVMVIARPGWHYMTEEDGIEDV